MNDYETKLLENIENYGCQVTHVFEDDEGCCFSYSIGIYKKTRQPELIITGLKKDLAHWMINEYNRRIAAGERFEIDQYYDGFLEGFQVMFKQFDEKHYEDHLGSCLWLYGDSNFKTLQLIWPSTKGVWPWDDNAPEEYLQMIPKLYKG